MVSQYFSILWEKDSIWNCRSDAGSKAVMTFLTALRLNPKGISRSTVANTDLWACKLYGGQPSVGLCESERQSGLFRFTLLSLFLFFFFLYCLTLFLYAACFLLSVMSNWELCFFPKHLLQRLLKGFIWGPESVVEVELKTQQVLKAMLETRSFFLFFFLFLFIIFCFFFVKQRLNSTSWGSCVQSRG